MSVLPVSCAGTVLTAPTAILLVRVWLGQGLGLALALGLGEVLGLGLPEDPELTVHVLNACFTSCRNFSGEIL